MDESAYLIHSLVVCGRMTVVFYFHFVMDVQ